MKLLIFLRIWVVRSVEILHIVSILDSSFANVESPDILEVEEEEDQDWSGESE